MIEVKITGKSTSATWYEIWEAVCAVAAMCVRAKDKGGKGFGMGEYTLKISARCKCWDLSQICRPPEEHIRSGLRRTSGSESVYCGYCQRLYVSSFVGFLKCPILPPYEKVRKDVRFSFPVWVGVVQGGGSLQRINLDHPEQYSLI